MNNKKGGTKKAEEGKGTRKNETAAANTPLPALLNENSPVKAAPGQSIHARNIKRR